MMKLDMVGLIVADMAAAQEFYQRLGFEVAPGGSADYTELVNQGVRISLNSKEMVAGVYGFAPATTGEKVELAFLCDSPAEVDHISAKMAAHGYRIVKAPWDAFWGQRYAIIEDVDGNLLSLFANAEAGG